MIYVIPTIPGWDSWATPVSFFVTTFLLGGLAVGVDFVAVTTIPRLRAPARRRHETAALPVATVDLGFGHGAPRRAVRGRAHLSRLSSPPREGLPLNRPISFLYGGGSVSSWRWSCFSPVRGSIAFFLHQLRAGTPGSLAAATSGGTTEGVASEGLSHA